VVTAKSVLFAAKIKRCHLSPLKRGRIEENSLRSLAFTSGDRDEKIKDSQGFKVSPKHGDRCGDRQSRGRKEKLCK
jgi:hypothetical protein